MNPYTAKLIERLRASKLESELVVEATRELEALSRRLAKAEAALAARSDPK